MIHIVFAIFLAPIVSTAHAQTVNLNLWFDGTNEQVNTGGDRLYEYGEYEGSTVGYWYDISDFDKAFSLYPYDTLGYYGSLTAPQIDNLGYVTVQYILDEFYSLRFGFNTVNGAKTPLDITETKGLCATYTSDHPVEIEINDSISNGALCTVALEAARTPTMVNRAIEEFKQPKNTPDTSKLSSCFEAFKTARSIWFKVSADSSYIYGKLRIFEIGPLNTCTGKGSIAENEPFVFSAGPYGCCKPPTTGQIKTAPERKTTLSLNSRTVILNGFDESVYYSLFDMQGNTVHNGHATGSIDLSRIKPGCYLLKVTGDKKLTQKITLD